MHGQKNIQFSKILVFLDSFKRNRDRGSDVIRRVFLTRDNFQAIHPRLIPVNS
jgi:hypothetical protein